MDTTKTYPVMNQIYVFGSNSKGTHNGGCALNALAYHGAVYGRPEGLQGRSYAIPTTGVSFVVMCQAIARFCEFALSHPEYKFMVTPIGCGHAGYTSQIVAPLFAPVRNAANVVLPYEFRM